MAPDASQITEAAAGDFERLLSRCLLTAYVFLTPPTTIILVLVGLMCVHSGSSFTRG
jgi:hypothetical protein